MQKYNIQNVIAKQNHNRKDTLSQFFIKDQNPVFFPILQTIWTKSPASI